MKKDVMEKKSLSRWDKITNCIQKLLGKNQPEAPEEVRYPKAKMLDPEKFQELKSNFLIFEKNRKEAADAQRIERIQNNFF